jgi:hypothetical protein
MKESLFAAGLIALATIGCSGSPDVGENTSAFSRLGMRIRNVGSGLCLDGYQGADGSSIIPYTNTCNEGNPYQNWSMVDFDSNHNNAFHLCNDATGHCLDGYANAVGGNPYLQVEYPTDTYQEWREIFPNAPGGDLLQNIANGACYDGYNNGQLGQRPYLWPCNSGDAYMNWTIGGWIPPN